MSVWIFELSTFRLRWNFGGALCARSAWMDMLYLFQVIHSSLESTDSQINEWTKIMDKSFNGDKMYIRFFCTSLGQFSNDDSSCDFFLWEKSPFFSSCSFIHSLWNLTFVFIAFHYGRELGKTNSDKKDPNLCSIIWVSRAVTFIHIECDWRRSYETTQASLCNKTPVNIVRTLLEVSNECWLNSGNVMLLPFIDAEGVESSSWNEEVYCVLLNRLNRSHWMRTDLTQFTFKRHSSNEITLESKMIIIIVFSIKIHPLLAELFLRCFH